MDVVSKSIVFAGGMDMTKEMEKEIEKLYELLNIEKNDNEDSNKIMDTATKRTDSFFEKRWDSSFFSNTVRY